MVKKLLLRYGTLVGVFILGAVMRFYNNKWDDGYYLHPDERFLTMVGTAMKMPVSFTEYLNPALSMLNPANVNFSFYVYGTLPLVLNKFLAIGMGFDSYGYYGLLGRALSATFDVITLVFVYKIARLLARHLKIREPFPVVATFFYAIAVVPIQLSHFFTTDIFQTTFMIMALYYCLGFAFERRWVSVPVAAIAFGLAVACKVSAVYMAPLYGVLLLLGAALPVPGKSGYETKKHHKELAWWKPYVTARTGVSLVIIGVVFTVLSFFTVRIAAPYYFQNPNIFDPTISELFLKNIAELKGFESREGYFPPAIQWMNKPAVSFSLVNLVVFGLGVPYAFLMFAGIVIAFTRYRRIALWALTAWAIGYFLYHSVGFVKVMRYTIFVYPIFALLAALAVQELWIRWRWKGILPAVFLSLIWPMMFFNIYTKQHSRVQASYWIYEKLPSGSSILGEHWDDSLPLLLPLPKSFRGEQLEVFGPDVPEKFTKMRAQMDAADYYAISSNRAWGSIPTVPDKYPLMATWYEDLFAGKMGYSTVKVITVYPSLEWLGIPLTLPDDWAEESFTVYDHPKVIILQNVRKTN